MRRLKSSGPARRPTFLISSLLREEAIWEGMLAAIQATNPEAYQKLMKLLEKAS